MAVHALDDNYLSLMLLVLLGWQLLFFAITYTLHFDKLTDFAGGTGFFIAAWITFLLNQTYFARQVVITVLLTLWSLRLAFFLLYRIIKWGSDNRFDDMRDNILKLGAFWVFQWLWNFIVSLPIFAINSLDQNAKINAGDVIGWIIIIAGIATETIADIQKSRFKADEKNKGRWCDAGLWGFSRHPNYFAEMLIWWGFFIATVGINGRSWRWVSVLSPLFTMSILLFLSGVTLGEQSQNKKHGSNAEYLEYRRSTSVLIPLPPSLYRPLPNFIKSTVLLDFPMYSKNINPSGEKEEGEAAAV